MSLELSLPGWVRRFTRDTKGVSAVEFALVLPLMMTLYLGGVEVSQGIAASRKVTMVSRTVADLASQSSGLTVERMNDILNASAAVISPYSLSKLTVTVSQIKIDKDGAATIDWSKTLHGTERGKGDAVTLDPALLVPETALIWTEAEYTYAPTVGYGITGDMKLKDQMYMRPRISDKGVNYPVTQ